MRMNFIKYFLVFVTLAVSGSSLMVVSHMVYRTEKKIAQIDREIEAEREKIRNLNAEWAFLNDPARLEQLAAKYLNLTPPGSADVVEEFENNPVLAEGLADTEVTTARNANQMSGVTKISYHQGGGR